MAKLKVSVDTKGRDGKLEKHVTVNSSDMVTPRFPITVTATVRPKSAEGEHP